MCVANAKPPANDARKLAVDLTPFVDSSGYWSSIDSGIIFTNVDATADGPTAACIGHNDDNVWFEYTPDSTDFSISVEARTGSPEGSIRYLAMGIWVDTSGAGDLVEIACDTVWQTLGHRFDDLAINDLYLLPNTTYFISILSGQAGIEGTFSLVVDVKKWEEVPFVDYSIGRDLHNYTPGDYNIWKFSADSASRHTQNYPPEHCYYPAACASIENPYYYGGPDCPPILPYQSYFDPFGNIIDRFGTYGPDPRQKYYVYLPDAVDSTSEVVVLIHGGGWVTGPNPDSVQGYIFSVAHDSETDSSLVRTLLDNDYVVVSLLYRLVKTFGPGESSTSTVTMTDQIDDIDSAVHHIRLHFPECLGINADKIHLLGESAGGQLTLMYAYEHADTNYVKSVISMYAPTNMPNYGNFLQKGYYDYPSFFCGEYFESYMFPVWWPWAMNDPIRVISTNTNICAPDTTQFEDLDNEFGIENGIWRIFKAYNFMQAAADIEDTTPLDNSTLNLLSPKTAITTGNPVPTFIMHGNPDYLVPYDLLTDPDPVQGMYASLNTNGGVTAEICKTENGGNCTSINLLSSTDMHRIRVYNGANHGWANASLEMIEILRKDVLTWILHH